MKQAWEFYVKEMERLGFIKCREGKRQEYVLSYTDGWRKSPFQERAEESLKKEYSATDSNEQVIPKKSAAERIEACMAQLNNNMSREIRKHVKNKQVCSMLEFQMLRAVIDMEQSLLAICP